MDTEIEELRGYIQSMKEGERVVDLGNSCHSKGTIYHDERFGVCVLWDKGEDGSQMSTSFTGGSRRITDVLDELDLIHCLGDDGRIHQCEPQDLYTLCGIKILRKDDMDYYGTAFWCKKPECWID